MVVLKIVKKINSLLCMLVLNSKDVCMTDSERSSPVIYTVKIPLQYAQFIPEVEAL